jgi:hypothetical protein
MKTLTTAEILKLLNGLLATACAVGAKLRPSCRPASDGIHWLPLHLWQIMFSLSLNTVHGEKSATEIP